MNLFHINYRILLLPKKMLLLFFQIIDPLPEIDHSDIDYEPFNKNFYEEHPEIQSLTQEQVAELRNKLGIRVYFCDLANLNH